VEQALQVDRDLLLAAFAAHERRVKDSSSVSDLDKVERTLLELKTKERSIAEAEIAAITEGRDTAIYRQILTDIEEERRALTTRMKTHKASPQTKEPDAQTSTEVMAQSLTQLHEVLQAVEITTAEKNALIGKVVDRIEPDDRETRIGIQPLRAGGTVKRIVTRLS
jgi:hypothetical protein